MSRHSSCCRTILSCSATFPNSWMPFGICQRHRPNRPRSTNRCRHHRLEAAKAFQAAVFMNPNFWQARYLLGVELAADEKVEEAAAQFKEVVRLRPDLAKAHFNLGVALGKQRKVEEALNEFRTTVL